ncbi:SNF2 family N-terminal domain-containing protein [Aspergillus undulatus]|uniref:SNF2 family N-terminal domain-containing protein n=1 Tax=Aspergillus undulatus TaxID=1810928 RepID=UPI003CCE4034
MSLKRLLNPTGTDGNQSHDGNLWPDDDPRVHPRLTGPEQWSTDTSGYPLEGFSYPEPIQYADGFEDQDMMFIDQYGPSPVSTAGLDPALYGQTSFLQPVSENNAFSGTSFTSTPVEITPERSRSAEVLMVDANDIRLNAQICYGMILRERVKLLGKGQDLHEKVARLKEKDSGRSHAFRVQKNVDNGELFLSFSDGTSLGYLSEKMVKALDTLIDLPRFELEAFAPLNEISEAIRRAGKAADAKFRVNINVYGLESNRDQVGKELSGSGLFLQVPDISRPNVIYDNPHMLRMGGMEESDTEDEEEAAEIEPEVEVVGDAQPERDADFEETIAEVFDSLRRQDGLNQLEGGENLSGSLYPHQAEALDFMTQRETGQISEEYRLWQPKMVNGVRTFYHVITKLESEEEPDESGGGILADEMGMGKSLTMLVLVGRTIREARHWADQCKRLPDAALAETPCRATLVIVPSRVLINTWMREVENHLNGSLKVLLYHGRSRKESIQNIEQYDIVITTYNTLAKEHSSKDLGRGKSPLHEFMWHRVVLDEAHMIRRRETTFHKAVVELPAKSRWCLSGTPIQNSLTDLAALLAFIQVRPFHDPRNFRHWIAHPFENKERKRIAIERLINLLEAICLRRTIGRVDLPKPQQEERIVQLTVAERTQYEETYAGMKRYIVQQAGVYNERASAFGMFQFILQLRSFCNHGTYQPALSWAKRNLLEEEADSVRSLTRDSLDRCLGCREPLPVLLRNQRPQYVEKCRHVLCKDCCKLSSTPSPDGKFHCPLCQSIRRPESDSEHDNFLLDKGYSSKMQTLVADVQKNIGTTQSIIFSCWTRTLDLIAKHLQNAKPRIRFRRIDGKTLPSERQQILDRFDGTKDVPVLIMTTGTGAFGLNLQSVNRVFIVEPQWNPSVESQAVARAIRLGQKQQVLVTRYRVENSIEEDMCKQQMKKLKLSHMDFAGDLFQQDDGDVVSDRISRVVPVAE